MRPARLTLAHSIATALTRLRRPPAGALPTGLHTCALCGADFVNPIDWEPVDDARWWILLRCGECDTFREVTAENEVAARYEIELNTKADILARALEHLDRQRMAAEVEAMIAALRGGRISAADFAV